jgi:uncharacterized protein (TIGR02680 family)
MTPDSLPALDRSPLPPLPAPARARWQPLRIGLVELFHYDCEEFWFRDGHLLLRGNNGTGKSKVLSLTLPFLLDASLSSARVEPDGDRGKRMEWNLLLGRYERRLGYSWIEFGRLDSTGQAHYLTLGCGMQAVAGRGRVEAWHFITSQRVGRELALITPRRTAISRDALSDALGGEGRVFETARDYRRAVDERLFRLGDRYDALIDTLIQLRQPQLSKKPDEQSLSDALTNALPELARVLMEDVAEAMTQLNIYRDELSQIERVLAAVSQFDQRYRLYAQIQARRQARVLRKAQTEHDNQSHDLHEAEARLERAEAAVQRHDARCQELDRELRRQRAILEELQADPAMLDARRLADLEQSEKSGARDLATARTREAEAANLLSREERDRGRREDELSRARDEVARSSADALAPAHLAGLAGEHEQLMAALPGELVDAKTSAALATSMRDAAQRRQAQLTQILRRLAECERAEQERGAAEERCQDRRATLERAAAQAGAANQELVAAAARLLTESRDYCRDLRVLVIDDADAGLLELQAWVDTMSGEQPLSARLERARHEAERKLASERSLLTHTQQELDARDEALRSEADALRAGNQLRPALSPTRDAARRAGRAGAPFWQLLEFRDHVGETERAGLEAALEAAGLLDAWVTPAGEVLPPDSSDAFLRPGPARASSLADWLAAAEHTAVDRSVIEALLAAIGCGPNDDADADSWLSPQGQFRLGRLHGSFHKPRAEHVGWAAREAARQRRLLELESERASLAALRGELNARHDDLAEREQRLGDELRNTPKDDALRSAHARFSALEAQRRDAQERVAAADAQLERSERRLREAHAELDADARDLRLPADPPALKEVELALARYLNAAQTLRHALDARTRCASELERQRQRALRAREELASRTGEAGERARQLADTQDRLELLRETALPAVTALERKLSAAKTAVREHDDALDRERHSLADARGLHGASEQRRTDARLLLESRSAERKQAAERLQGFTATGLLALALPDLEAPDRTVWSVDASLNLARRIEERLTRVSAEDDDWTRVQSAISHDFTALGQALSALGQRTQMEQSDYGLLVQIIHQNRPERPDVLERLLAEEVEQRRGILSAREREILENHLQAEVAAHLQRLLRDAEARVERINQELKRRPTSTGVFFRLDWEPLPEGSDGAPVGLGAARTRLLRRAAEAWSVDDRRVVGEFLALRIASERALDDTSPLVEHLARALDYRRWHRFRVKRWHDGAFRPLAGPASSGERALGLTVPLFAAASSHYESADCAQAPRLVLLDEAFAGIDDEARAHCMALIREFDLDFVMTSEREWGCYAALPGVAICQIVRREGVDAAFVSRFTWDGRSRRAEPDPTRRFTSPEAESDAR